MVIIVGEDRQVIVDAGVDAAAYFSDVLIAVNFALSEEPTPLTAVMIATAIPAAIRLYSIAVAPDSLCRSTQRSPVQIRGSDLSQGHEHRMTLAL